VQAEVLAPLLDLGVVETSLSSNELDVFLREEAGGDIGRHSPIDEDGMGVQQT